MVQYCVGTLLEIHLQKKRTPNGLRLKMKFLTNFSMSPTSKQWKIVFLTVERKTENVEHHICKYLNKGKTRDKVVNFK